MTDPGEDTLAAPRRRRIPLAHLAVLALFTVVVAPFLRPAQPDCPRRVSQALADEQSASVAAEVLRTCRRELERYTRESDPEPWAQIQLGLGTLLAAEEQHGLAADANRSALLVFTRERNPRCWASLHFGLARLLIAQQKKTGAAAAYRSALLELDPDSPAAELARRGLQETQAAPRGLGASDLQSLLGDLGTDAELESLLATCRAA